MVSTQANTQPPLRRPKSKLRTKRTKRRLGRRIGTTPSDSKSSLENSEPQLPSPISDQKPDESVCEPKIKKRSFSEERQTSRVKLGQRSSSLQLDSTQVLQPSLRIPQLGRARNQQSILSKRKAWFFSWPVRLAVPNRGTIEDEGFDSFHGNNSSSSDCEHEENVQSNKIVNMTSTEIVGFSETITSDEGTRQNEDLQPESHCSDPESILFSEDFVDKQGTSRDQKIVFPPNNI